MGSIFDTISKSMAALATVLLLFVTASISYSILTRILGVQSPIWVVQFNEYALLWVTFLAGSWVLGRNKHVSIDLVTRTLSPRRNAWLSCLQNILGGGVCSVLTYYGAAVTWGQFQRGVIDVKAVDMPKYLLLIIIPIGFLSLTLQFLRRLLTAMQEVRSNHPQDDADFQSPSCEPGRSEQARRK